MRISHYTRLLLDSNVPVQCLVLKADGCYSTEYRELDSVVHMNGYKNFRLPVTNGGETIFYVAGSRIPLIESDNL